MLQSLVTPSPCFTNRRPCRSFDCLQPISLPSVHHFRRLRCSASIPPIDFISGKEISNFLDLELKVRDHELDQYGVVNNAVYACYCDHAHHELLHSVGVNAETIACNGTIALSELSFKYLSPLRSGDKFVHRVRVTDSSAARLYLEHIIYKLPNVEPVLEAKATAVWLGKNCRPVRITSETRLKLIGSIHPP